MKMLDFRFEFLWNLFLWGLNDNKSAIVHVMAWRWTSDKQLHKQMLTLFNWCIYAAVGGDELIIYLLSVCQHTKQHGR